MTTAPGKLVNGSYSLAEPLRVAGATLPAAVKTWTGPTSSDPVALEFSPSQVTVDIRNPLPPAGAARPLAGAGTGYGLVGLKERAALGGGSLIARPTGGEWRVSLTMPA